MNMIVISDGGHMTSVPLTAGGPVVSPEKTRIILGWHAGQAVLLDCQDVSDGWLEDLTAAVHEVRKHKRTGRRATVRAHPGEQQAGGRA